MYVYISQNDIANRNIINTIQKFYVKVNSILYDFRNFPCDVKAKLLSTYCLDSYDSQLWNYSSIDVQYFYVAWRKTIIRRLWKLPNTTHYCLPLTIVFQLTLFLNSVVLKLFGHVLIVTTQLLKLLHYPLFPVVVLHLQITIDISVIHLTLALIFGGYHWMTLLNVSHCI